MADLCTKATQRPPLAPPHLIVCCVPCCPQAPMTIGVFFLSLKCNEPSDTHNSDAISTSSDLLNLLLGEDLCSATGSALSRSGASATSDSLGSSSLGCDASRSGAGMFVLRAPVCVSQCAFGFCLEDSHRMFCPWPFSMDAAPPALLSTADPSHQNSGFYPLASNSCVNEDIISMPALVGPVGGFPGHWFNLLSWVHMCRDRDRPHMTSSLQGKPAHGHLKILTPFLP